ncbi:MAG: ATP-binding protein, partial [Thermodesulfobacteriota bacterium]|nr:ATP-binding protein [Thermodesulfobacteriota bacterium]
MKNRTKAFEIKADNLRWSCDPDSFGLTGTADIEPIKDEVIAQERAVSSLKFGMKMAGTDYNIYVAGEPRTGLTYLTRSFLKKAAKSEPTPPDWCYIHNFREPDEPRVISLPGGVGRELAKEMEELIYDLKSEIPNIFEGEDYRRRKEEIIKKFTSERNPILSELEATAKERGFILNMSPEGMMIAPFKEGQPMTEEDLHNLTDEEKEELKAKSEALQEEMNKTVLRIKRMEKKLKGKLRDLDKRVALAAVGYLIDDLQEKYADYQSVLTYLKDVKTDVIRNLDDFKPKDQPATPFPMPQQEVDLTRYKVNVFIDNSDSDGAPVVYEVNPTYTNLFGAMERRASFGALFTDFTMIRPGSMHRANGGYLVIRARDLLKWYVSWEALKRALTNKEIKIEDMAEMFGFISTKGMKPESIPLNIKIILIGEPYIYHLLYMYDDQFKKLFK